jgi:protein-S-isoprenylcysteine O-methyltransferase Ste14
MILLVACGFGISAATGIRGSIFLGIVPEKYYFPIRVSSTLVVAIVAAHAKRSCDAALEKAGTKATFEPVPAIADTGPYEKCRNPMYWAILFLPAAVGLMADNAWVVFGSNFILWLYLHFVVVPAEEKFPQTQLGDPYKKYCASVKRWGFF